MCLKYEFDSDIVDLQARITKVQVLLRDKEDKSQYKQIIVYYIISNDHIKVIYKVVNNIDEVIVRRFE
jgi:hypothetical protein